MVVVDVEVVEVLVVDVEVLVVVTKNEDNEILGAIDESVIANAYSVRRSEVTGPRSRSGLSPWRHSSTCLRRQHGSRHCT